MTLLPSYAMSLEILGTYENAPGIMKTVLERVMRGNML